MVRADIRVRYQQKPEYPVTRPFRITAVTGHTSSSRIVEVCTEETAHVFLNDIRLAALKITPEDLPAFAVGFTVCEGFVPDCISIEEVLIDLQDIHISAREVITRGMEVRTEIRSAGTGVGSPSGVQGLPLGKGICIDVETLFHSTELIRETSPVWKETGGTHCTAIIDPDGNPVTSAEDIGRHNSIDKAVGKALLAGEDLGRCFLVCTGRLPADMVAKAYRAGITVMISNNAPFSSGIELAERMNMTLAGFARSPKVSIYTHPERIQLGERIDAIYSAL
jgi:FdhD protein